MRSARTAAPAPAAAPRPAPRRHLPARPLIIGQCVLWRQPGQLCHRFRQSGASASGRRPSHRARLPLGRFVRRVSSAASSAVASATSRHRFVRLRIGLVGLAGASPSPARRRRPSPRSDRSPASLPPARPSHPPGLSHAVAGVMGVVVAAWALPSPSKQRDLTASPSTCILVQIYILSSPSSFDSIGYEH